MKRQIRRGVFETNSSSTHSLTMMMKSDYEKWSDGNYLLTDNWYWNKESRPKINTVYTKEEAVELLKKSKYAPKDDFDWDDDNAVMNELRDCGFKGSEDYNDYLESFYEEFTTPSGEVVVAFGEYGYDG